MVKEGSEEELPVKVFKTDDGQFNIKCKGLSLERFEDRLSSERLKKDP